MSGSAAACERSREGGTQAGAVETVPALAAPPRHAPPIFFFSAIKEAHLLSSGCCYHPGRTSAARRVTGATNSIRDAEGGKGGNWRRPKCPIIILVNHVQGDESPKRHPTQRGPLHRLSDCLYHPNAHFASPPGNSVTQHN